MLMFYWSRNKQKTKTNDATIIVVSVYFSCALDPFINLNCLLLNNCNIVSQQTFVHC